MKVCTFYEEKGRETKHQTMISTAFEIRLFLLKINFVYSKLPEITFVTCRPEPHVPLLNPFYFFAFLHSFKTYIYPTRDDWLFVAGWFLASVSYIRLSEAKQRI